MSRAKKLFAVSGDTTYEGGDVVAVFDLEVDAKAFAERCREHDRRMPEAPSVIEDTPENDAAFAAWGKKCDRWRATHPAKMHSTRDSWNVFLITYYPKDAPK